MVHMQIVLNDVVLYRRQVDPAVLIPNQGDILKICGTHYVVCDVRWVYGAGLSGMHVFVEEG